jgi:tetratricopeptide (TPR) repeat protein
MLSALAALPCAAAGKTDADLTACSNVTTKDWAINVAACTRYLQNRRDASVASRVAAYANRGFAYQQKGEIGLSIEDYDQASKLKPKEGALYSNRGISWQMKGDLDRAIADHEQAVRLGPNNAAFYLNRGRALREKGDLDRAIADFGKAISLQANFPNPYAGRGLAWRAKGDLKRAIADYDAAIRINPKVPVPYVGRGLAYEEQGDKERARADFNMAIALPTHAISKLSATERWVNVDEARFIDIARTRLALLSATNTASSAPPHVALPQPMSPNSSEGRGIALVIGNGAYANASALPNPPNDARAVAKTLRDIGFDVTEGIDLDRPAMDRNVRDFLLKAAGARLALLFYAGHGMQIDGHNYLVPIDASFAATDDIARSLADLDTILVGLDNQIRTNIVILDACRDNPMAKKAVAETAASRSVAVRSGLAAPSGLGRGETSGAGTLLAFATAPGQVALDGDGINSPFSTALVRHIGTPGLEVQQMLTRVRAEVVASTKSKQVPWSNSSLLGEIYLAGKP